MVNDGKVNSNPSSVTVTTVANPCVTHNGTEYCEVVSPYTGKVWLDRNLGAAQVCTAYNDTGCYGDYYQWGRNFDGHEDSGSGTTDTQAATLDPGHSNFIKTHSDWAADGVDDDGSTRSANWSATNGSSVCPIGYRVPTLDELKAELFDAGSAQIQNRDDAYNSFLKLPSAGSRYFSGTMYNQGLRDYVWSSSTSGSYASVVHFDSGDAGWYSYVRADGLSVTPIL